MAESKKHSPEAILESVGPTYPGLRLIMGQDQFKLTGPFPLLDSDRIIDEYILEIEFPNQFPAIRPNVREVANRIHRIADRHVYLPSGNFCLAIPEEEHKIWKPGGSILEFLKNPVTNFLIYQTHFELKGVWPHGQWSHGLPGRLEFYQEKLRTKDPKEIMTYLRLLAQPGIQWHAKCPCNNGTIIQRCSLHRTRIIQARGQIPFIAASDFCDKLMVYSKK